MERVAATPMLTDSVYRNLSAAIADLTLRPGQRIRQDELAASLGVSRQPVSHALQLLKQQGLVRETGRKGLVVTPIEPDRIRHLYEVRASIDALAARLAASRVADGDMLAAEQEALRRSAEAGARFGEGAALSMLVEADVTFHQAIYGLSGNPVVLELLAPQWSHLRRSMVAVLEVSGYRRRAWDEHGQIARLILAGDADGAAAAAHHHCEEAGRETGARLQDRDTGG